MRGLYLYGCGILLLAACGTEATAPRVLSLRLVPTPLTGFFTSAEAPFDAQPLNEGPAVVGQPIAVTLQVVDQNDTPVQGITVRWSVLPRSGSLDAPASISDTGGIVRTNWTPDTIAKLDSLEASLASGNGAIVTASGVHALSAVAFKVSGDAQTVAPRSTSSPFVVRVTDRYGNPVGRTTIAWNVIAGDGALNQITTQTDANGLSQVTLTAGALPSDGRVLATFGFIPAVVFSFKAR